MVPPRKPLRLGLTALLALGVASAPVVGVAAPPGPQRAPSPAAAQAACDEAYTNVWTPPGYYYPAGSGVEVLDDLHLGPLVVTDLCSFEIGYHNSSPDPATATIRFYANDPLDGPPGTALVTFAVPGLASGTNLLHVEVPGTALLQDVWLGVSFDTADAGLLLADPPWPGASDDLFYHKPAAQYGTFGGNPVANFMLSLTAEGGLTGVGSNGPKVVGILSGPSPNPSLEGMDLIFVMPSAGHVRAEVLDVSGRVVAELADRAFAPGEHSLAWDGRTNQGARAAPGVYWLRLTLPGYAGSRKLVMLH